MKQETTEIRAAIHTQMPELLPEIKAMVDAGLIEGWRNVTYCGPHCADPLRFVSGRDICTDSNAQIRERIKHGNA